MKKILGAAVALSLIGSAAFADITVSGRGYVETQVFNYTKGTGTSLFGNWDTGDSDVFVSGDIGGKAGAMLNIDFGSVANGISVDTDEKTISGSWIGDWNVWIKPLDFLTIKASNEANRVANRYNSIIDKTESKWGVLGHAVGSDSGNYNVAADDDSFKGYQVNMDFGVVKVDLGFNKDIQKNGFAAASMVFDGSADKTAELSAHKYNEIGVGARVVVPVEGLLNVDALFKMYMKDTNLVNNAGDEMNMTFGAIVDVVAIDNMGLAIGYIGHSNSKNGSDTTLTSAVDVRFQYNMDKMGFALHNNATFDKTIFADKLNLGFMYGLTDAATLFVEVQNLMEQPDVGDLGDVLTVYPRFAFGIAEGVTLKTGLRADFGIVNDDTLAIALPLSMEVIF